MYCGAEIMKHNVYASEGSCCCPWFIYSMACLLSRLGYAYAAGWMKLPGYMWSTGLMRGNVKLDAVPLS